MKENPLILTLTLDQEAARYFTDLRDRHFPPERNFLQAHLTLFHKLPQQEAAITDAFAELCPLQPQLLLEVAGPVSIGNGVAYKIISKELQHIHRLLQVKWQPFLSPQDRQKLNPHITIQNKVAPQVAKELQESLQEGFKPFMIRGTGLRLWEYLGGPWKPYRDWTFLPQPLD